MSQNEYQQQHRIPFVESPKPVPNDRTTVVLSPLESEATATIQLKAKEPTANASLRTLDEQITQLIDDESPRDRDTLEPTVIEHVSSVVDSSGGTISCPQSGAMLIIPNGAINEGVFSFQFLFNLYIFMLE